MKKMNIIKDYIEIQKLLNVAKKANDLSCADLIIKLNKISTLLLNKIIKNSKDKIEMQVLTNQITQMYQTDNASQITTLVNNVSTIENKMLLSMEKYNFNLQNI